MRSDETNNTFQENNPSNECDDNGPVSPRIVEEYMRYSEHQCTISQKNNHTIFLYELEQRDDIFAINHQCNTSEDKDDSPELCEKNRGVHTKDIIY